MDSLCVVVPKKKAEPVRRKLMEKGILRKGLQVRSDAKSVYLPVTQRVDLGYPIESRTFDELEEEVKDYRLLVDLPDELRQFLPSSYDVLGAIALVKMADEVRPYEEQIGKAIMTVQKAVKTVCVDEGVKEEYRTRQLRIVAGEKNTETIHKEYGMVFKIDVRKVFFSPRLATERDFVARQVQPGEVVIDMFAGIGPFSLMIAKSREPKVIYAIDTNPEAIGYMQENIVLNKVDSVRPILGDAKDEVRKLEKADRIIMNLPHNARDFLSLAIDSLKPGGVIHFYEIMEDSELENRYNALADIAVRQGRVMKELGRRKVKSYSPTSGFYAFDLSFL